jgi:hypothetical protein
MRGSKNVAPFAWHDVKLAQGKLIGIWKNKSISKSQKKKEYAQQKLEEVRGQRGLAEGVGEGRMSGQRGWG